MIILWVGLTLRNYGQLMGLYSRVQYIGFRRILNVYVCIFHVHVIFASRCPLDSKDLDYRYTRENFVIVSLIILCNHHKHMSYLRVLLDVIAA